MELGLGQGLGLGLGLGLELLHDQLESEPGVAAAVLGERGQRADEALAREHPVPLALAHQRACGVEATWLGLGLGLG